MGNCEEHFPFSDADIVQCGPMGVCLEDSSNTRLSAV